jgi:urease accessory protein
VGRPESLVAITATSAEELARLAWHIGNRHIDMEIIGNELRIRRDHVLEDMLRRLGARVTPLDAPFYPEGGAYDEREDSSAHKHA